MGRPLFLEGPDFPTSMFTNDGSRLILPFSSACPANKMNSGNMLKILWNFDIHCSVQGVGSRIAVMRSRGRKFGLPRSPAGEAASMVLGTTEIFLQLDAIIHNFSAN